VRALNSAVTVTALPATARLEAEGDSRRLQELLVRGCRYTLALVVPLAVTGMVLAAPALAAWLGPGFRSGAPAMAILMSHWLLNGCSGLLTALLAGMGRARAVARWAVAIAIADVALALALTPWLDLEGIAIATSAPYIAFFPLLLRPALEATGVGMGEFTRQCLVPALSVGAGLAAALGAVRLALDPEGVAAVVPLVAGGVAAYWATFYRLVLDADERSLVREVGRALRRP
jgi:O-antigen/teichoic acid export membrane protein